VTAVVRGDVDAIVAFKPHSLNARELLADNGDTLNTHGLYTSIASMICEPSVSEDQPETVRAILRGLIDAETYIAREPQSAVALVARKVNLSTAKLAQYFGDYQFKVALSRDLLTGLNAEGSWGARNQKGVVAPDYRAFIADRHLRSLDAARVSL